MFRYTLSALAVVFICLLVQSIAFADVKVASIFNDHMVLQREKTVPVWGTAAVDEKVTVKFAGQEKSVVADKDSKWMVKLDALKTGGPEVMTITGKNTVTINDVLIGEVWIGSGQSNMAMNVASFSGNDPVLAEAAKKTYPKLRMLVMPNMRWVEASDSKNINNYSALLFAFGYQLQKALGEDVPIGLMASANGGTASGMWVNSQPLIDDPACQESVKKYVASGQYDVLMKRYQDDLAKWEKDVADLKAKADAEPAPVVDPNAPAATTPVKKELKLPNKPGQPQKPGDFGWAGSLYKQKIVPLIPYAIRGILWDQGEAGSGFVGADNYPVMGVLFKSWRNDWKTAAGDDKAGDFPFLYVQKPSGGGCAFDLTNPVTIKGEKLAPLPKDVPGFDGNRELYARLLDYPNVWIVQSSDLGKDTHPVNKSGYGARAVQVALGSTYSKKVETNGPIFKLLKIEDNKIRLEFTHAGQGLTPGQSDKLQGFAIAGEDKKFVWGDAVIDGQTVVVSSDKVAKPTAVRYFGVSFCNLFNKDGLPALIFRTDK
ncbi:MAG: sialate O-acetylesterase [bacterium]